MAHALQKRRACHIRHYARRHRRDSRSRSHSVAGCATDDDESRVSATRPEHTRNRSLSSNQKKPAFFIYVVTARAGLTKTPVGRASFGKHLIQGLERSSQSESSSAGRPRRGHRAVGGAPCGGGGGTRTQSTRARPWRLGVMQTHRPTSHVALESMTTRTTPAFTGTSCPHRRRLNRHHPALAQVGREIRARGPSPSKTWTSRSGGQCDESKRIS